jgi:hypothetical protein
MFRVLFENGKRIANPISAKSYLLNKPNCKLCVCVDMAVLEFCKFSQILFSLPLSPLSTPFSAVYTGIFEI